MSIDDFDIDINTRLARLAIEVGKGLGKELKNYSKYMNGDLEWDELTTFQKGALGNDRSKYYKIKNYLKGRSMKSSKESGSRA